MKHGITQPIRLIAILRGISPGETPRIVECLLEAGFRAIEVPLNSSSPFKSIELAAKIAESLLPGKTLIGAGTVLDAEDVDRLHSCGANLIVSPNVNDKVIAAAVRLGMTCLPGVFTPTEAHRALKAGATGLKFFPAFKLGPDGIAAIRATLPADSRLFAVGGIGSADFSRYFDIGVEGFGTGSSLYRPGMVTKEIKPLAEAMVESMESALAKASSQ